MPCLNCNKEIIQIPKKREKMFCNSTCRSNFWQKEKRKASVLFFEPTMEENKYDETVPKKKQKPVIEQKQPILTDSKPSMPEWDGKEDKFDFAQRKNEWKRQYGSK